MHMNHFNVKLQVVMMKEQDTFIAFCPALDLSSCGSTEEEAKKMFVDAAHEFFTFCLEKGTLEEVLQDYGWQKFDVPRPNAIEGWVPPHILSGAREITVAA